MTRVTRLSLLFLFLVFGTLIFAGLGGPVLLDYDEGVYAEVSREMFVEGEWLVPQLYGEDWYEKPPLLYWSQMVGYQIFGLTPLGARVLTALAGLLSVLLLYLSARRPLGQATALRAAVILGSNVLFIYLARIAMTDMILSLFFQASIVLAWLATERAREGRMSAPIFWLSCLLAGFAMLTKGAIGLVFPAATLFIYLITVKRLPLFFRPSWIIPGTIILLGVGLSWYLMLGLTHPEGFAFMQQLFMEHHVGRFTNSMEGHSGPFFFYAIILLVGFLPWFPYLFPSLRHCSLTDSSSERGRFLRFYGLFALITFVFFSIAATKLPNYIMPALPGLALLAAPLFSEQEKRRPLAWNIPAWIVSAILIGGALFLVIVPHLLPHLPEWLGDDALKAPALFHSPDPGFAPYLGALILLAAGATIIFYSRKGNIQHLFNALAGSTLAVLAGAFFLGLPFYNTWFAKPLCDLAVLGSEYTPEGGTILMLEIKNRPSAAFASGRYTRFHNDDHLDTFGERMASDSIRVAITTDHHLELVAEYGLRPEVIARDKGYVLFRLPETATVPDADGEE